MIHGIDNRKTSGDTSSTGVYIHKDIFLWVFGLQKEQLGHDKAGHMIFDRASHEDNPLFKKTWVNVKGSLTLGGFLNYHWDEEVINFWFCFHK